MTDRELLLIAYGAIKAISTESSYRTQLGPVLEILEEGLFPPKHLLAVKEEDEGEK